MTDITTFLLARYDEEEAVARAAVEERRRLRYVHASLAEHDDTEPYADIDAAVPNVAMGAERFLADIRAKRELLGHLPGERYTIEAILVAPYANHLAFDPSWRTS